MTLPLSKTYTTRFGAPSVSQVDPIIFRLRIFGDCMAHDTCVDRCCAWGVDVDVPNMERLYAHADALEPLTGFPKERWFEEETEADPEYPGGRVGRTRVEGGTCVFRNRAGRGCLIHSYALTEGHDVVALKPLMSSLFPLSFSGGVLLAADEVEEGTLFCGGAGVTIYDCSRETLKDFFGEELVSELDCIQGALPEQRG